MYAIYLENTMVFTLDFNFTGFCFARLKEARPRLLFRKKNINWKKKRQKKQATALF